MTNAATYASNFARILSCSQERVELAYELDSALWPWLRLPPHHPVLIEKYQYFGAMTASWEQGVFTPETFTALTWFAWDCAPAAFAGNYGTRGLCEMRTSETALGFSLDVSAANGRLMYQTRGEGFAFNDRDYRCWRDKARHLALEAGGRASLQPISPEMVGLSSTGQSFIGLADQPLTVSAYVSKLDGYVPNHPFHTGSRDHVNAAQLLDCGLQAAHWFVGDGKHWTQPLICTGGEARFQRYVELDVPFTITLIEQVADTTVQLQFSQAGHDNVLLVLKLSREDASSLARE